MQFRAIPRPTSTRNLLFALAVGLLCVLAGYELGRINGERMQAAELLQQGRGWVTSHEIALSHVLDRYQLLPEVLAEFPLLHDTLQHPRDAQLLEAGNRRLQALAEKARVSALYLMDAQGQVLVSSNWNSDTSFVGHNFSFRPYFVDAMAQGRGRYIAVGRVSARLGLYLSRRMDVGPGAQGVLVVKVGFEAVNRLMAELGSERHVRSAITGAHDMVLASGTPQWLLRPLHRPPPRLEDDAEARYGAALLQREPVIQRRVGKGRYVALDATAERYLHLQLDFEPLDGRLHLFLPESLAQGLVREARITGATIGALVFVLGWLLFSLYRTAHRAHRSAMRDSLTGQYNRTYMEAMIPSLIAEDERENRQRLALVMFDLDHFKQINDRYGHVAGDQVLEITGRLLTSQVRECDVAVRYGGEEFAVFLRCDDISAAEVFAHRLRAQLKRHVFHVDGGELSVTASFGLDMRRSGESLSEFVHRVDELLYRAKKAGRDRIVSGGSGETTVDSDIEPPA